MNSRRGELEQEKRDWYQAVILRAPEQLQTLFHSFVLCKTGDASREWERTVLQAILDLAVPIADPRHSDSAMCPLCDGGSSHPYSEGYTLPIGMERHLMGHGQTRRCPIMYALFELANERFFRIQDEEWAQEKQIEAKRKLVETIYKLGPFDEPELLDHHAIMRSGSRDAASLAWAEIRIAALGFTVQMTGNVKTVLREYEHCVVFADLRGTKNIEFRAFPKPLKKPNQRKWRGSGPYERFCLHDSWKNNLVAKYEAWVNSIFPKK